MNGQIITAACEKFGQRAELSICCPPFGFSQQFVRIEKRWAVSFSIWANKPLLHMPGAFPG
jgi:hypothetical protein